jgi:hypothetical protein
MKIKAKKGDSELKAQVDMKKKAVKNDDGTEKVEYQLKQRAELKFPGIEEGHEVSTWAAADNQWMKCSLAPKNLASGDGKTDLEF